MKKAIFVSLLALCLMLPSMAWAGSGSAAIPYYMFYQDVGFVMATNLYITNLSSTPVEVIIELNNYYNTPIDNSNIQILYKEGSPATYGGTFTVNANQFVIVTLKGVTGFSHGQGSGKISWSAPELETKPLIAYGMYKYFDHAGAGGNQAAYIPINNAMPF